MKESTQKPTAREFLGRRLDLGDSPESRKEVRNIAQVALILDSRKNRQDLLLALQNNPAKVRTSLRKGLDIENPNDLTWCTYLLESIRLDAKMPDFSTLGKFLDEKREIWPDISLDYTDKISEGNNADQVNITATLHEGLSARMGYIDITTGEIVDTTDEEILGMIASRKAFGEQMEGNNHPKVD